MLISTQPTVSKYSFLIGKVVFIVFHRYTDKGIRVSSVVNREDRIHRPIC